MVWWKQPCLGARVFACACMCARAWVCIQVCTWLCVECCYILYDCLNQFSWQFKSFRRTILLIPYLPQNTPCFFAVLVEYIHTLWYSLEYEVCLHPNMAFRSFAVFKPPCLLLVKTLDRQFRVLPPPHTLTLLQMNEATVDAMEHGVPSPTALGVVLLSPAAADPGRPGS